MSHVDDERTAVINRPGQVAFWPAHKPVPTGWTIAFIAGTRSEASEWIESRVGPEELASRLREHPAVHSAHAVGAQVTAHLNSKTIHEFTSSDETIEAWDLVFSDLYDDDHDEIAGWIDFVNGRPYTEAEMADWVNATRQRVETLPRKRVVEVGCGTGLIAQAVLDSGGTAEYIASDLTDVASRADSWDGNGASIQTIQAPAQEALTTAAANGPADLTILHSVIQYFPSTEYAAQVLTSAAEATAPGGHIYVGDVRHLAFHDVLTAERAAAQGSDTRGQIAGDMELGFRPSWFESLIGRSSITRVDVTPRLGSADTEMTKYRFDVLLHVGCRDDEETPSTLEVSRLSVEEWTSMLHDGQDLRLLVPNGWHKSGGLTPQQLMSAAATVPQGHLSLRFCNDGPSSPIDARWRPKGGDSCMWGHGRLHEEWRSTPIFAQRNHDKTRNRLFRETGLTLNDIVPGITLVLADQGGSR